MNRLLSVTLIGCAVVILIAVILGQFFTLTERILYLIDKLAGVEHSSALDTALVSYASATNSATIACALVLLAIYLEVADLAQKLVTETAGKSKKKSDAAAD